MSEKKKAVCSDCKNLATDLWNGTRNCVVFGKEIKDLSHAYECMFFRDLRNYRWNEEHGYVEYNEN